MKLWFNKRMPKTPLILPASPIDGDSASYAKDLENERVERASLILDFSKQQYDYALDRTRNVEEKALKVFSSLSIVVTAFVFLIRYISTLFFTAKFDIFYVLTLITGGGTFLLISLAWYNVFRAVHLTDIHTQGYGSKTDDYVFENSRDVSIWGLARRYSEAAAIIDDKHTKKAEYVGLSIKFTGYTALCFVIFVVSCLLMALYRRLTCLRINKLWRHCQATVPVSKLPNRITR